MINFQTIFKFWGSDHYFVRTPESLLHRASAFSNRKIMGSITRIGHPSFRPGNDEKALVPSAPKLFDIPTKSNYHTSTGFGKPFHQTIVVKAYAIWHSVALTLGSPLLCYSSRRQCLPLVFPSRKCWECIGHCQNSKVVSHFDLPPFRCSSRRSECKAYEESWTLHR